MPPLGKAAARSRPSVSMRVMQSDGSVELGAQVDMTPSMALVLTDLERALSPHADYRRGAVYCLCDAREEDVLPFMPDLIQLADRMPEPELSTAIVSKIASMLTTKERLKNAMLSSKFTEASLKNEKVQVMLLEHARRALDRGESGYARQFEVVAYEWQQQEDCSEEVRPREQHMHVQRWTRRLPLMYQQVREPLTGR